MAGWRWWTDPALPVTMTIEAGARHAKHRTGGGDVHPCSRLLNGSHHLRSPRSVEAGKVSSNCATVLRNSHGFGTGMGLRKNIAERFGPPLEIGQNALMVTFLVVGSPPAPPRCARR